jgi:hypothetical protein
MPFFAVQIFCDKTSVEGKKHYSKLGFKSTCSKSEKEHSSCFWKMSKRMVLLVFKAEKSFFYIKKKKIKTIYRLGPHYEISYISETDGDVVS